MSRPVRLGVLALLALLPGCKLAEVTAADARDVLVVESLLRADSEPQFLLLHRSLQGTVVQGEPGATVVVTDPEGGEHRFVQDALPVCARFARPGDTGSAPADPVEDSLTIEASCYVGPSDLRIRPGGTYELRVTTREGEVVRGRTTVPGDFGLRGLAAGDACRLPPRTNLPVRWSPAPGAWSYFSSLRLDGIHRPLEQEGIAVADPLDLTAVSISERDTTIVLPSEFGIFEAGDLQPELVAYLQGGLPEGSTARLTVAAMDRNYVDAVRGGDFNPSGSTRISSVVGDGVGVFGSLVARSLSVVVSAFGEDLFPACLPG